MNEKTAEKGHKMDNLDDTWKLKATEYQKVTNV